MLDPRAIIRIRSTPPGIYSEPVIGVIPLVLYSLGFYELGQMLDRKMPHWIGRSWREL